MAQGSLLWTPFSALDDFDSEMNCCSSGDVILCECRPRRARSMPTVELENTMLHGRRSSGPSEDRGMGGGDSGDEGKNDCVLYEMGNGIATLTLNRPEVRKKL